MKPSTPSVQRSIVGWQPTDTAETALFGLLVAGLFVVASFYYEMQTRWTAAMRSAGSALALVVLALQVSHGGWLTDVDRSVTAWTIAHRSPVGGHVAVAVTNLFGPVETVGAAVIVAVLVGWWLRSLPAGLTIVAAVGGASVTGWLIKLLVARARPPVLIQETVETDYSFPSGHVTGTAAVMGITAAVLVVGRSRAFRALLTAVAAVVVCAVAASRVYLGVHWLTDVVAGALLGAMAVTIAAPSLHALRSEAMAPDRAVRPPISGCPQPLAGHILGSDSVVSGGVCGAGERHHLGSAGAGRDLGSVDRARRS